MRSPGSTADGTEDRTHSNAAEAIDASGLEDMDQSGINRDATGDNDDPDEFPALRQAATTTSPTNDNGGSSKEKDGTVAKRPRRKQPFPYKHLLPRDGYNWVKYGQKQLSGGLHMRHYFHCMLRNTDARCPAKRIVNMSKADNKAPLKIEYINDHNHRPHLRSASSSPAPHQQRGASSSAEILLQPVSSGRQFTLGISDGHIRGAAMGGALMESGDADSLLKDGIISAGANDGGLDALRMLTAGDGNDYAALRQTLDEAIRKATASRVHQQRAGSSSGGGHVSALQVSKLLQSLGRQEMGQQLPSIASGSSSRGGGEGGIAGGSSSAAQPSLWQRRAAGAQAGAAMAAAAAAGLSSAANNPPTSLMADVAPLAPRSALGADSLMAFASQLSSPPAQAPGALAGGGPLSSAHALRAAAPVASRSNSDAADGVSFPQPHFTEQHPPCFPAPLRRARLPPALGPHLPPALWIRHSELPWDSTATV
ncbi:unnamed protein product [Closterium sp. Yama58-4]|nr:unnamed protein product [Closterium sp. Yama58-4]